MGRWLGILAGALLLLPTLATAQARVDLPIREVDLSSGLPRYTVNLTIGGVRVEAGLDSGSTGLRVLPGVVPDGAVKVLHGGVRYSYAVGTAFDGVLGETVVSFGDGLGGPVPVQMIKTVGCREGLSDCPARHVTLDRFGIQGNGLPGEGFKAILGVNMGPDQAPNPLLALGVKRWIILLPQRGDGAPGKLILNPTDEEASGYTPFPIDPAFSDQHGGLHDAIGGCIVLKRNKRTYCGPLVLDTGAPGIDLVSPTPEQPWANGEAAQVVFTNRGKPLLTVDFEVGRRELSSRFSTTVQSRAPGPRLFMGLLPYFAFSVLYDPAAGTVGLKGR